MNVLFYWVNTEMVWCVVWQAPGCCTVEQRARMCVGWREKQPAVKSAWLPQSFSHPKVRGRGGRKAFTTCWGKESLTGQMYLCDEETVTYSRQVGSAVLIKRKGNTLSWKKKIKKSLGQKHHCGSVIWAFDCQCQYRMFPPPAARSCCSMLAVLRAFMTSLLYY